MAFSGRSSVVLPPTRDRALANAALVNLHSGEGTALGDAISQAVALGRRQRAADSSVPPTSVLVISDGAQMSGRTSPAVAALEAKSLHIPIYTVVVGTPDGVVTVSLSGGFQAQIRVPPNPDTLKTLAQSTGGQFFTAGSDTRLREVYEKLGSRLGRRRETREITDLFAGGSAALLLAGGALSALWFRRMP